MNGEYEEYGPLTPQERASVAAADQEREARVLAEQRARVAGERWPGWQNIMHREPAAWGEAHRAADTERAARYQERSAGLGGLSLMGGEHEGHGPQPPSEHELYRARERVLEADQAGGSPAEVAQAQASARQTEAAYSAAAGRDWERDPAYRAEITASYDGDRYADREAGS